MSSDPIRLYKKFFERKTYYSWDIDSNVWQGPNIINENKMLAALFSKIENI